MVPYFLCIYVRGLAKMFWPYKNGYIVGTYNTRFAWAGGTCPRFAWAGGTYFPVVLVCCVSFWFWQEIGFGCTYYYVLGVPYSCGVVVFLVLAGNSFWCYVRT